MNPLHLSSLIPIFLKVKLLFQRALVSSAVILTFFLSTTTVICGQSNPQPTGMGELIKLHSYELHITGSEELDGYFGLLGNTQNAQEYPVLFQWISPDGKVLFESTGGLKLHGSNSGNQKAYRLTAKSEYGPSQFEYPFFPNKHPLHNSLVIRRGGNDNLSDQGSMLRDPLIHYIYSSIDSSYISSASIPCVLYINNAYQGIANLREHPDEQRVKTLSDSECIHFLERTSKKESTYRVKSGSDSLWNTMLSHPTASLCQNWRTLFDEKELLDYLILQLWIGNRDWLSNNTLYFKACNDSTPWHWVLWDTDWGLGLLQEKQPHGSPEWNSLEWLLSDSPGWNKKHPGNELFKMLFECEDFQKAFIHRSIALVNGPLSRLSWHRALEKHQEALSPLIAFDQQHGSTDSTTWQKSILQMRNYIYNRGYHFLDQVSNHCQLGLTMPFKVNCTPPSGGGIYIHELKLQDQITRPYLSDGVITAKPNDGYQFLCWDFGYNEPKLQLNVNPSEYHAIFIPEDLSLPNTLITVIDLRRRDLRDIRFTLKSMDFDWRKAKWKHTGTKGTRETSFKQFKKDLKSPMNMEGMYFAHSEEHLIVLTKE